MLSKSKLITLIYIILAGGLIYFAYPIIKSRYFEDAGIKKDLSGEIPRSGSDEGAISQEEKTTDLPEEDIDSDEGEEADPIEEEEAFFEIKKEDCDNRCQRVKDDQEILEYCQETCGLSPSGKDADGCEDLEGLKIDYCYKDLAVSKKDFKICEKIGDSGIRKTCINRVTEEIFNGDKEDEE